MINNHQLVDIIERANDAQPVCPCGRHTTPVYRDGAVWLECSSLTSRVKASCSEPSPRSRRSPTSTPASLTCPRPRSWLPRGARPFAATPRSPILLPGRTPSRRTRGRAARVQEYRRRLAALRSLLDRRGDDAALLSSRVNFAWLTAGGTGHILQSSETAIVTMLVARDHVVAITQNIEAKRLADEELDGLEIELAVVPWWEPDAIEGEARRRVGHLSAGRPGRGPGARSRRGAKRAVRLRSGSHGDLGQKARVAMEGALGVARPGMTEDDVVADLLGRFRGCASPWCLPRPMNGSPATATRCPATRPSAGG